MSPTHFTQPPVFPPEWQGDPRLSPAGRPPPGIMLITVGMEAAAFVPHIARTHLAAAASSPVPHAPADKGSPPLPNFLTLGSRSISDWAGWEHRPMSEALGRGPGALVKPAGCTCLSQRRQQSGGRGARSLQLKFKLAASAPPRPAREATAAHWLLSPGPPAAPRQVLLPDA